MRFVACFVAAVAVLGACGSSEEVVSSPHLSSGQCEFTNGRCSSDSDCCSNWCVNQYCMEREP